MKFDRADREIQILIQEIRSGGLDLQPDFQRGEVWREHKQELLIDSILRGWYVPPIHVIDHEESHLQEILDGQQRLRSVVNFVNGSFPVNGSVQPLDPKIQRLDGKFFNELPEPISRAFMRFTITQYTLTAFRPAEPAELFFRLNQNMPLTPAETRNAFVGAIREQVKILVQTMLRVGLVRDTIGFSNSRMSYDDVLARLCVALEWRTIAKKITAKDLDERYRSGIPFSNRAFEEATNAIEMLGESSRSWKRGVRFNKATLFSWLWFISEAKRELPKHADPERLGSLLSELETIRKNLEPDFLERDHSRSTEILSIVAIYHDRATSRVADVSSVVLRDTALWVFADLIDSRFRNELRSRGPNFKFQLVIQLGLKMAREPLTIDEQIEQLLTLYSDAK